MAGSADDRGAGKQPLREATWAALQDAGAARFPGTRGRIPNFVGAEAAADRLAGTDLWAGATVIKSNPDSPQRPVRHRALKAGKIVVLAVPKLASDLPFVVLDPAVIPPGRLWAASSIKGAAELGVPVRPDQVPPIDLIVTGCVGVDAGGARLGKGGGYSDLEYAMLRELELVGPDVPIVTTVHRSQEHAVGAIPMTPHDISLDLYALPDRVVRCDRRYPRPDGVDWSILPADKRIAIPVLEARHRAGDG